MNRKLLANILTVAAGLIFLLAVPGPARADNPTHAATQAPRAPSTDDDFAGLVYTDDQKAEIAKIRQDMETRKSVVAKDDKLTADQKDAMIQGYSRMEYGAIFEVLTPEQRKEVTQKVKARRATEQASQKKQPPRN